jgi:arylsulfatase A-like enzyme
VPAFVNWPEKLKPYKLETPMHVIDWMPTLASMLGSKQTSSSNWEGVDMWYSIKSHKEKKKKREFYFVWGQDRKWEGLRYGEWKIIRKRNGEGYSQWELYNLENDPYETQNMSSTKPMVKDDLIGRFEQQKSKDKLKKI